VPLRILSVPGKTSSTQFLPLYCQGLEQAGIKVVDIKFVKLWCLKFDVINVHFPAHYIVEKNIVYSAIRSALSLLFYMISKRVRRCTIIYTVHDVIPLYPRAQWLLWPYLKEFHRLTDGYIFLSDSSRSEFCERFPSERSKPWLRVDHGSFPVAVADLSTRLALRNSLPVTPTADALLVGFLGSIKAYKGIETLLSVPRELGDGTPVRIVVAGAIDSYYRTSVEPILIQLGGRLIRIDGYLCDKDLEDLIRAVDVVFLPYMLGWNSGMAMLVLSTYSRILAADRPLFRELKTKLGSPWIYTYESETRDRETALREALELIRREAPKGADRLRLSNFLAERTFTRSGRAIRKFCETLHRSNASA
jgi:glycosyltransferase involved in cell wall biosynthesis